MFFNEVTAHEIYKMIYSWLCSQAPGEYQTKSSLKNYSNKICMPIIKQVQQIRAFEQITETQEEFLSEVLYTGLIFRIQQYHKRRVSHVCPLPFYQSWSKSLEGLQQVSNLPGDVIILEGHATDAIDVFGLLHFFWKNSLLNGIPSHMPIKNLLRYEQEQEVLYPIQKENIINISVANHSNLSGKQIPLPQDKWFRNSLR